MGFFIKNKRRGRKIINHHIVEGTRESHPRVHDLQYPRLGKPRRGLQIMDTRMGFPCPFHSVVIDSITHSGMKDRWSTCKFRYAGSAFRNLHVDPLYFITL